MDPARAAYDRGVEALSGSRFEEAVPALEDSYRLRRLAIVMYNLGLAYRGVHRNAAAINAFETFIATHEEDDADTARVQAVRDEITRLRALVGTLVLAVNPADAVLRVDGRTMSLPLTGVLLDPGTHSIELNADGYRSHREEVTVHPTESRTLEVRLDRAPFSSDAALAASRSQPSNSGLSPVLPVGAGVGVLAGGVALGLWLSGNVAFANYQTTCANSMSIECSSQYQDLNSTRPAIVNTLWVVAGIGLAAAVIGVVRTYAQNSSRRDAQRPRVSLLAAPTSTGIRVTW